MAPSDVAADFARGTAVDFAPSSFARDNGADFAPDIAADFAPAAFAALDVAVDFARGTAVDFAPSAFAPDNGADFAPDIAADFAPAAFAALDVAVDFARGSAVDFAPSAFAPFDIAARGTAVDFAPAAFAPDVSVDFAPADFAPADIAAADFARFPAVGRDFLAGAARFVVFGGAALERVAFTGFAFLSLREAAAFPLPAFFVDLAIVGPPDRRVEIGKPTPGNGWSAKSWTHQAAPSLLPRSAAHPPHKKKKKKEKKTQATRQGLWAAAVAHVRITP